MCCCCKWAAEVFVDRGHGMGGLDADGAGAAKQEPPTPVMVRPRVPQRPAHMLCTAAAASHKPLPPSPHLPLSGMSCAPTLVHLLPLPCSTPDGLPLPGLACHLTLAYSSPFFLFQLGSPVPMQAHPALASPSPGGGGGAIKLKFNFNSPSKTKTNGSVTKGPKAGKTKVNGHYSPRRPQRPRPCTFLDGHALFFSSPRSHPTVDLFTFASLGCVCSAALVPLR